MQRSEFSIEDIGRGRTMMIGDLDYIEEQGGHIFECNKVRTDPNPIAPSTGAHALQEARRVFGRSGRPARHVRPPNRH